MTHLQMKLVVVSAVTLFALGACGEDEGSGKQPLNTGGATGAGGGGTAPLPGCGDGQIVAPEQCDGANTNAATCAAATMNTRPMGTPTCSPQNCMLVTTSCTAGPSGNGGMVGSGGMVAQGGRAGGNGGAATGAGGRQ